MKKPERTRAVRAPRASFTPVAVRPRHDGWSPGTQTDFIDALAECGCVEEACARVGKSATTAYALRRRPDAYSFRAAWDAALDFAVRRLGEAAFGRALRGVSRPVFYQGEQIGERRYYDERLTQFILRYRDPARYGKWLDHTRPEPRIDSEAVTLAQATLRALRDAQAEEAGDPRPRRAPVIARRNLTAEEFAADAELQQARRDAAEEAREEARMEAEWQAHLDSIGPDPDAPRVAGNDGQRRGSNDDGGGEYDDT